MRKAGQTMEEAEAVIRPLVEALPGYEGHLELATGDGRILSITVFDSDEHAMASERTFDEEMPSKLGELFRDWNGRRTAVDYYTVIAESRMLAGHTS